MLNNIKSKIVNLRDDSTSFDEFYLNCILFWESKSLELERQYLVRHRKITISSLSSLINKSCTEVIK